MVVSTITVEVDGEVASMQLLRRTADTLIVHGSARFFLSADHVRVEL
jgi:hypothetical protein